MTRRHWPPTLACLLCAALAGCAGNPVRDSDALPLLRVPSPNTISAEPAPAESPYHVLPSSPPPPKPETPPAPTPPPAPAPTEASAIQPTAHQYREPETPAAPAAAVSKPTPANSPVVEALMCLEHKQPAEAMNFLKGYGPPNQDLLLALLALAARISDQGIQHSDPRETAISVDVLESCLEHLRRHAVLVLDKVCFCKWIDKFGVYEPLPDDHPFVPGSQVHVYVELRNFAIEQSDHCFQTRLASRVTILDAGGKVAQEWSFNDGNRPERSQSARHDYFINYSLPLPRDLKPGRYKLMLHVDDLPTKRCAEQTLELTLTTRPCTAN